MPDFLKAGLIGLTSLLLFQNTPAYAQDSILMQILEAKNSLVTVKALNTDVFKTGAQAAIDPRSGKLIVLRKVAQANYERQGAGVIVHASGVVVTNAHTVARANRITVVLHDGTEVPAEIVRFVSNIDMTLLKINPPFLLTAIPIADSNQVRLGDDIITVGNSALLKETVTGGKVIGLGTSRIEAQSGFQRNDLIQTTINLYQGDSGGPLFNNRGELIGLMTAKETGADHSSFAIPANSIKEYLLNYLKEVMTKSP